MSFESQYAISYWWLIVTLALFLTISEIRLLTVWNISFKIAAKLLEMETWLLLTAYRKSPAPYPTAPLPTFCDFPFRHNIARLAYHSALWPFKVIQGRWFWYHL